MKTETRFFEIESAVCKKGVDLSFEVRDDLLVLHCQDADRNYRLPMGMTRR